MKMREELETPVGDADVLVGILEALGFHPGFKYEKFREEFRSADTILAVDETPVGVFVEIEGDEESVHALARLMDRSPADYITDSYRALFVKDGVRSGDMLFADRG
jgi:adenylate cyclase class 2